MERTKLRFDDGITGIVGPNGCGKSNVVDAIRWVMGEQSSRMLRGKAMEDVIFAGSESKPPMGLAEVEITFENDGLNVPPEYAHFKDISVGRRLYRSGESEYLINRTLCRLLDVQELFMGTGVGTRAYSIIGQGQIGLLVSQKPSERRSLIEEAAGVSKYKARKKTAERKMEQTRQNLLRVADVVQEIRRNMGSLQRQARKAARYHKLRNRLRDIELHSASHRYLEMQAMLRHLRTKQELLTGQEAELHSRLARLEAGVEQDRTRLLDDDRQIGSLQEALLSTDNQIKLNEQNIEFLNREVATLSGRGQESAAEIEALRQQQEQLADEIRKADQELADLEEVSGNAARRLSEREEIHRSQAARVESLEAETDADRQAQLRGREQTGELRSRQANLDQRLVDLEGRLGQARAERKALQERQRQLQEKKQEQTERLGQLRQLHLQLVERREFEENSLAESRSQAAENEAKSMALREEIANRRSRLESLKEIERNYEGCMHGVRHVMKHAGEIGQDEPIVGLVADILRSPPRYETAVQAVLGERLQSVVVRSQENGLAAVDYLKREAEGRSSFIPLDLRESAISQESEGVSGPGVIGPMFRLVQFEPDHSSVVRYLMGDVVVVEDLSSALGVWTANGHKATLVTLDGEVLEPQGVLTGGSLEGAGTHLLQNKREMRELQEKLVALEADYRMVQDRHGKLKTQNAGLAASIDDLRQNSHEEEIRIVDQQKDLGHLHEQLAGLSQKLEALGYECQRLEGELAQAQRERSRNEELLQSSGSEQTDLEERMRTRRVGLENEKRVLAGLLHEVTELKIRAAATIERQESARRNQEHLVHTRADLAARVERLRTDISTGNLQSVQSKQKIEQSRQEIAQHLAQRERQQAELGVRREAYERLLTQVQEQEVQAKQSRSEQERVTTGLSAAVMKIRELEVDQSHLITDIRRNHKTELIDNLSAFHLLPPPGEQEQRRAEKLRHDLERMGDVNPHAVEQFEQLKQRYEFLSAQSQDLNDSLEKLQKVIQKINRTSRKRFREAFDAINAKFQEVFPRLFRGGRAHLVLEAEQDLLEAGVDIVAQPPGKKLQNIELLSGGEKALTAVALLFSIFLIKPTPFCLLDEVDAPLDDVNIERFNQMVKEMSVSSQFIIITHNKRTMELLDRLYGVTMEEPGISNIVSVELKEIERGGEGQPGHEDGLRQAG
jgi:chromosome segregation protein